MFKRNKAITKLLSIFFICVFALSMTIPSAEFAFAKGDDDSEAEPEPEYNGLNTDVYDIGSMGLTVKPRNAMKLYAVNIETLLMSGEEVEEIFIGYYDKNQHSRYKRIGPHDFYSSDMGLGFSQVAGLSRETIEFNISILQTVVDNYAKGESNPVFSEDLAKKGLKEYKTMLKEFDDFNEDAYCKFLNNYYGSYANINEGMGWEDANPFLFAKEIFSDSSYNWITEDSVLEAYSSTAIFFQCEEELNDVFSISIYMNGGDEVFNMKSCKLYEVTSRDKIYMYSDISNHPYINFAGKLLYNVENIYYDGLTVNLQHPVVGNGTPDAQCFTFFANQINTYAAKIKCDAWTFRKDIWGWTPWDQIGCIHREFNYQGEAYLNESEFPNWQDYPVTDDFKYSRDNEGGTFYNSNTDDGTLNECYKKLYNKNGRYYQAKGPVRVSSKQNINHYNDPYVKKIGQTKAQNAIFDSGSNAYTVALTFADKYAGGLNAFIKGIGDDMIDFSEMLYANVTYERTDGMSSTVEVPVITNSLFKYIKSDANYKPKTQLTEGEYATYKSNPGLVSGLVSGVLMGVNEVNSMYTSLNTYEKLTDGGVYSYGQQGDTICFDLNLPNCKKITDMRLSYRSNYEEGIIREEINILGAKIYNKNNVSVTYSDDGTIDATVTGTPLYSYAASTSEGLSIITSSNATMSFTEGNLDYATRSYNNQYLIKLTTDNVAPAGTMDNVNISFQYVDTNGKELRTSEYPIGDYIDDYFGYWIGEEEKITVHEDGTSEETTSNASAAYPYCMREGGEIYMIIRLSNLSEFLGFTLSMDDQQKDEWQLDGIQINRIDDLSKRKMKTIYDINEAYGIGGRDSYKATVGDITVDRVYYRDVTGDVLYAEYGMDLLVQSGGSITHTFTDEGSHTEQEIYVRNYSDYYYSMDWETANKDLGFTLPTKSYTVMVDVPTNLAAGTIDDGTGSRNLFYFQLVFKNGKSAYVLANTQLQSDGFVAGATSTFEICTNEDYGDLVSINIIPDDIDENSDKLDKLCISKITVIKDNKNGINKSFVIDEDFWVKTEYRTQDTGSLNTTKIGRKEGDLVVNKIVESSAYMLTYEFAITTAQYQPGETQFEGQVLATIAYYNSKGETKYIYDHDIVKAMYNYRNENWVSDNLDGWNSDPKKMFRGESTDRFKINIDDAVGISSITFKIKSKIATTWTIKQISVGIVTSEGVLYVNNNSEMQMKYQNELDPQLLVDKVINHDLPYSMNLAGSDTWDAFEYQFDDNAVPNIGSENEKLSVVERIPSSANDTANIYVYLPKSYGALDNTYPDAHAYKIYGELSYEGSHYSYKNKTEFRTALQPDGSMILFATGLNAQNFVTLSNLKIYGDVIRDVNHKFYDFVDYAVIQQIRGNTVVDTYTIHYNFQDIMEGPINMIGADTSRTRESIQELSLTFDTDTVAAQLNPMNYDIAVSLSYTTTNDPANGGRIYHSPYVFLTDQDITSIQAGKTIMLQFHEDYVKDIVGVDMVATGGIKACVENGYLNLYTNGSATPTSCYGIYNGGEIHQSTTTFQVSLSDESTHSITPIEITFVTADAMSTEITGTTEPVTISIGYKTIDGQTKTKTYKNAQLYLGNGQSFKTGMTATMNLNLIDFKDFRTVTITPTDSWYVKKVIAKAEGQAGERAITIDKKITKDEPYILNFASIKVKANAITDSNNKTTENGAISVNATEGTTVTIKVDCDGSLEENGYKAIIEKVTESGNVQIGETIVNSTPKGTIEIDMPTIPEGKEEEEYIVTITCDENPSLISIVNIKNHK